MKLSKRAQNTNGSPIRTPIVPNNKNTHVHKLNIGQPDVHSPKEFLEGIKNFDDSVVAYESSHGNTNLIDRWTALLNRQYDIGITKDEMLITCGSSEALTFIFSICCDVNDEILVFSPSYANYSGFAAMAGVRLVSLDCSLDSGFHIPIDPKQITKHITRKTKAILICNPNNPTGTVFTHEELKTLVDICDQRDLFLIVDEVYREFVYDGLTPQTIFQISPRNPRLIVIDSVSKRYSLCGARVGCILTWNHDIMNVAMNFASTRVSGPTIEQRALAHMLEHMKDSYLTQAIEEYQRRRDVLVEGLRSIDGVEFVSPQGGFYILAKLPVDDASEFVKYTLREFELNGETVSLAPANGFFIGGKKPSNFVRIAFVLGTDELRRASMVIKEALTQYKKILDDESKYSNGQRIK